MIDYSGDGLLGHDTKGKAFKGQVFVGVLGHSGYIFAWVTSAQTREDWLQSIAEMFKFFSMKQPKRRTPPRAIQILRAAKRVCCPLSRKAFDAPSLRIG